MKRRTSKRIGMSQTYGADVNCKTTSVASTKVLEWTLRTRTGSLYVKPALDRCSPITHSELVETPACPVK
jgi:hypothetical protein